MRQRVLFTGLCVYVCPDALPSADFELLECCLRDGGAALSTDAQNPTVTHVVCHPSEHARFAGGHADRFYAIVRPEWVLRAFVLQKVVPVDAFSADPRLFFSTLAIAADAIDKDPRKVIDGLIAHFGGQVIDDPSDVSAATHVLSPDGVALEAAVTDAQHALQLAYAATDVARQVELWKQWLDERPASLDFPLPGCVVAHIGKYAGVNETHHVNYAWIEECLRRKQLVAEAPFSKYATKTPVDDLPNWKSRMDVKVEDLEMDKIASVYLNARAAAASASTGELAVMRKVSPERLAVMQSTLAGAIVLVAQHIPSQLKEPVAEILKAAKAKVANVPLGDSYPDIVRKVVTNASFVVCRYQSGLEYEEAVRQNKQIVSVYWVLAGLGVASEGGELREALLQPVKRVGGVPGMESFVITLSGFNSRTVPTREDVQMAIQSTGACVLPVLSRSHSTHLLCFEAKGEKFKKAQSWNFDNILSPEWLLECLVQWKYILEGPFRMTSGSGADAGKTTAESVPIAAETEREEVETIAAAAAATATGVTNAPTATDTDAKPSAPSRFDVDEILDELNERTPKTRAKRGAGALKLGTAAADVPAKLFDSPTSATKKRTLRGSTGGTTEANEGLEASIPEDFEFQFGKKAKSKGKAKAADRKVVFNEKQPEKEPTKGKRNAKRKSGGEADVASAAAATDDDTAQETVGTPSSKGGAKGTIKNAASTGRKRKSMEAGATADNGARPTAASSEESRAPSTATKKKKTAAKPTKETSSSVSTTGGNGGGRLFLLTGSRAECAINESLIISLGGAVSQVKGRIYDPRCTHIITSELKRTEKFVAGCAAGKWILKQSYLDACSAAGRFVDEADHEWGTKADDVDEMDPRIWPPVCSFWRKARAEIETKTKALTPGAFDGWRFLVHPKAVPPAEMCERIITASDGQVIPLVSAMDLATLAASETKQKPVVALVHAELSSRDIWLKKFRASKVRCINASFLIDYLTKDQTNRPKVDDYVL